MRRPKASTPWMVTSLIRIEWQWDHINSLQNWNTLCFRMQNFFGKMFDYASQDFSERHLPSYSLYYKFNQNLDFIHKIVTKKVLKMVFLVDFYQK